MTLGINMNVLKKNQGRVVFFCVCVYLNVGVTLPKACQMVVTYFTTTSFFNVKITCWGKKQLKMCFNIPACERTIKSRGEKVSISRPPL